MFLQITETDAQGRIEVFRTHAHDAPLMMFSWLLDYHAKWMVVGWPPGRSRSSSEGESK